MKRRASVYTILVRSEKGKRPFGGCRIRIEDDIKTDINIMCKIMNCYEHYNV